MLSPGLFTTIDLGTGKIGVDGKTEKLIVLHGGVGPFLEGAGLYLHNNYFKDSTRSGLFYTFDCGADIITTYIPNSDDSDDGVDPSTYYLPILAGGIGYSKQIGNNSYFRFSIKLAIVIHLNLSFSITL
jgi:hypothetical protein